MMHVDVAIAGGGPAASAAAITLAGTGLTCAILERDDERGDDRGDKPGESLAPNARPLLHRLGVWDALAADGHLPCHGNRSRWGSDGVAEMPFLFSPYGHGWHVDRRRFERLLVARAESLGVRRFTNTPVTHVERSTSHWTLGTLTADFLIDATGRASSVARRLGARRIQHDALIASVAFPDGAVDSYTMIEATRNGWWYTAAIPDGRVAAMFVTDRAPRESWGELLEDAPHTRRRIRALPTNPEIVDAGSSRLDRIAGERWLAIGDAAAAFDPLSSHGLTAALDSGVRAGEAIANGTIDDYTRSIDILWNAYTAARRELYAAESRWPEEPFWQRRRG